MDGEDDSNEPIVRAPRNSQIRFQSRGEVWSSLATRHSAKKEEKE